MTKTQTTHLTWSHMWTQRGSPLAWLHLWSPALRWIGSQGGRMNGPAPGVVTFPVPEHQHQQHLLCSAAPLLGLLPLQLQSLVAWAWLPQPSPERNDLPAGTRSWRGRPSGLASVRSQSRLEPSVPMCRGLPAGCDGAHCVSNGGAEEGKGR